MRAGAKPPFQEVSQFAWRLQPEIGGGGPWLISNENAQSVPPVTSVILDGAEGRFVGQVIAENKQQVRGAMRVEMRVWASGLFEESP